MPTALERGGDFSQTRDAFGRPVADRRSGDRPAVSRQRDPARRASARRRRRCSATTRCRTSTAAAATTIRRRCSTTTRQDAAQSRFTQQPLRPQSDVRQRRVSADDDRRRPMCSGSPTRRRVSGIDAAVNWSHRFSQFLSLRAALSVHAPDHRGDAVLRQPHQRVGRGRHRRQQSGSGELGSAERCCSPSGVAGLGSAQYAVEQQPDARLVGREPVEPRPPQHHVRRRRPAAALRRPVAAERARQLRASPARRPAPISPTSCSASRTQRDCVRQCRQVLRARPPTTRTSPTTGGSVRASRSTPACAGSTKRRSTERFGRLVEPRRRAGLHRGQPCRGIRWAR